MTACALHSLFLRSCRGGDIIYVSGHGFGFFENPLQPLSIQVGQFGQTGRCSNVTLISNTNMSCVLPPAFYVTQMLSVIVQVGYVQVYSAVPLLSYAAVPIISRILGERHSHMRHVKLLRFQFGANQTRMVCVLFRADFRLCSVGRRTEPAVRCE